MIAGLTGVLQAREASASYLPDVWFQASSLPTAFEPRWDFSAAAFPPQSEVILFGGAPAQQGDNWENDTWVYDDVAQTWSLGPAAPPGLTPRGGAAMAYDAAIGKIVLFGGSGANVWPPYNDTWLFDGNRWTKGPTAPPGLASRTGAEMVYMDSIGKVVLFGGAGVAPYNDTWLFDGTKWSAGPAAPPDLTPRVFFGMTYDQSTGKVVVAGGSGQNDVWYFDGVGWSAGPAMIPEMGTPERVQLVYDPLMGGDVLFGGLGPGSAVNDIYLLADETWSLVTMHPSPRPLARLDPGVVWDPVEQAFMVFGGVLDLNYGKTALSDSWLLASPLMTIAPTSGPSGTLVTIQSGPGWPVGTLINLKLDRLLLKTVLPDAFGMIRTTAVVTSLTGGKTKYLKLSLDPPQLGVQQPFYFTDPGGRPAPRGAAGTTKTGRTVQGPRPRESGGARPAEGGDAGQITAHDGQFWLGSLPIELRGVNASPVQNTDLELSDYQQIADWNMNFVRMRIRWSLFEPNAPTKNPNGTYTHDWDPDGELSALIDQIGYAQQNGEFVLIENYCGPPCLGNGYPDWLYTAAYNSHRKDYSDPTEANTDYWTDSLQQQFTSDWLSWLAGQLKTTKGLVGYELMNEPDQGTLSDSHTTTQTMLDTQLDLAQSVRSADPARVIFFTTRGSSGTGLPNADLSGWTGLGNVAFDVHGYFGGRWGGGLNLDPGGPSYGEVLQDLFDFTLTPGMPPYLGTTYGQMRFAQTYQGFLDPQGIPLVVGEFGVQGENEPNNLNGYGTMAYGFDAAAASWAVWTYNGNNSLFTEEGDPEPWASIVADAAAY